MIQDIRLFSWKNPNGLASRCALKTLTHGGKTIFVATELKDNPGPSITNGSAELWRKVSDTLGSGRFIEHYDDKISYGDPGSGKKSRYAEVIIEEGQPTWKPLDGELLGLVGD